MHIGRVIEAIVKALDPNVPHIRENVIQIITSLFFDLVHTYPQVAFHGSTQRLAVGSSDGVSIVYDLKTGTRWQILEVPSI